VLSLTPSLLTSLSKGPPVVDLQRNYRFSGLFYRTDWVSSAVQDVLQLAQAKSIGELFGQIGAGFTKYRYINPGLFSANLAYISQLIKAVEQPMQNLITDDKDFGPLKTTLPSSISMEPFVVTFVEEILGSVEYFYRNLFLEYTGGASLTYQEINKVCLSFMFTRNVTLGGVEVPSNVYLYPKVLPVSYELEAWDKSNDGFVTSRVTFIRFADLPKLDSHTANNGVKGFNPRRFS